MRGSTLIAVAALASTAGCYPYHHHHEHYRGPDPIDACILSTCLVNTCLVDTCASPRYEEPAPAPPPHYRHHHSPQCGCPWRWDHGVRVYWYDGEWEVGD